MKFFLITVFCTIYAGLNVAGAALIKQALKASPIQSVSDYLPLLMNLKVIGGFGLIGLSALVLFKALSDGSYSLVIPLATGINFLLTLGIGTWLFGDRLTGLSYFGISLVFAGVICIGLGSRAS